MPFVRIRSELVESMNMGEGAAAVAVRPLWWGLAS